VAAAAHTYVVVLDKMKFGALPSGLRKGDMIIWVNRDFLRHTATAADHSFDVDLPAGAKAKTVLKRSGTIAFVCRFHPGMRGVFQVK
jgi:plastocyanin